MALVASQRPWKRLGVRKSAWTKGKPARARLVGMPSPPSIPGFPPPGNTSTAKAPPFQPEKSEISRKSSVDEEKAAHGDSVSLSARSQRIASMSSDGRDPAHTCACCGQLRRASDSRTLHVEDAVLDACNQSFAAAEAHGHAHVDVAHLITVLGQLPAAIVLFWQHNLDPAVIADAAGRRLAQMRRRSGNEPVTASAEVEDATDERRSAGRPRWPHAREPHRSRWAYC